MKTNSIINLAISSAKAYVSGMPVKSFVDVSVVLVTSSSEFIKTYGAFVDVKTRSGAVLTIRIIPNANVKKNTKIKTTPATNNITLLSNLNKIKIFYMNISQSFHTM
jgi:hypothetical protein